ncbi:MAG TPA: hypothetical protein VIW45_06015 [Vicinamibacterales bacterium]|jgi:hypothetical protein
MMNNLTRSRVIQMWFVAVALVVAAAFALGANLTLGRWMLILGLCLVPPAMLFKLWPVAADRSMKDLIYESGRDR